MPSKKTTSKKVLNEPPVLDIVVLAAGLGTRMKSDLPKVLHRVCGQPMLQLLLEQLDRGAGEALGSQLQARLNVVVGYGRDQVEKSVRELSEAGRLSLPVVFTVQEQQLGTGHAVKLALEQGAIESAASLPNLVAVVNGDLPLFAASDFASLLKAHLEARSAATLASAIIDDAGQYGRVIRKGKSFSGVVEYKDATPAQKEIREYNGGVYVFDRELLDAALNSATNKNAAGEFYLPDVFSFAAKGGKGRKPSKILAQVFADPTPLAGVNNMKELAWAQRTLYQRKAEELLADGIFIAEPAHTYIGPAVKVGRGSSIGPFTTITGVSVVGEKVQVGSHCELIDVNIGDHSQVKTGTVAERSTIGRECQVGPMARLRPGSQIGDAAKIGNFVEIKESKIGSHTNVAHLSYVGDAEIGSNCNLGCGFITCNFDGTIKEGRRKHRTIIGNNVFIGSDSQVVAPIEIADGVYVASGSTVTESVHHQDSLVIARTRQVTKEGYAKKYRP